MIRYELLYRKEPTLEDKIIELLRVVAVSPRLKGYRYLVSAITIAVEHPETVTSVTKSMYVPIAEQYGTTVACVEAAIRRSIDESWLNGDLKKLYEMFGHTVHSLTGRPGEAEFIAILAKEISTGANTYKSSRYM